MVFVFSFQIMHVTKIKYLTEYGFINYMALKCQFRIRTGLSFSQGRFYVGASLGNSVLSQLHLVTLVCLLLL